MTSTKGYNHLFWHEFRSLPKGSVGIRIHSAILFVPKVNGKRPVPRRKTSTA